MRRHWNWTTLGALLALSGAGGIVSAQESQQRDDQQQSQKQEEQSKKERSSDEEQQSEQRKKQPKQKQERQSSDDRKQNSSKQTSRGQEEIRLHYDDDKSRLSIDVDEDIRLQDGSNRRDVLSDGEIDLRYDTDENDLRTSGEGTIDVDRAVSQMGRWWQSWWDDERQARRGRTEGAVVGAGEFIRQYDDNDDQQLTRRELPPHMRSDFQQLDRDNDGSLTRLELSRYGEIYFDLHRGTNRPQQSRTDEGIDNDDYSWSQWWSSWWSNNQSNRSQQDVASSGSRQLLQAYDRNDDGFLAKSELPERMQEDFGFVDRNNDGYVSRNEVQQYGYALRTQRFGSRNAERSSGSSGKLQSNSTSQAGSGDEQTWSQWWSSWWSDESSGQSSRDIAANGARHFLRQHDDNDDEVIVRSEMPRGMYDEFQSIDTNGDRRLTRQEISTYASRTGEQLSKGVGRQNGQSSRQSIRQPSDPMSTAYVWIIDANHGHLKREDLQEAYGVLRKLDTNADGEISQSELERRREQAVAQWCEKCFDKLDQNNDDRLSRGEAENSMFSASFDEYDQNEDSRLSRSEAKQGVKDELESQSASRSASGQSNRR